MAVILFYTAVITVLLTANVVLHGYLWRRLVTDTAVPAPWVRRLVGGTLVLFAVVVPLNFAATRFVPRDLLYPLPLVVWTWLGVAFYLALCFGSFDVVRLLRRRFTAKAPPEPQEGLAETGALDRRVFLSRALAGAAGTVALSTTGYGLVRANGDFDLPEVEVRLPRLPRAMEGFRIALLSDIHIGPVLDGRFVDHIVESTNRTRPDLVCITGDLVDGSVANIGHEIARLAGLKARHGVAFSTGNHEYYSGVMPWLTFLEGLGFHVLGNRHMSIGDKGPGGASFDLAGIYDRQGGRFHPTHAPDMDAALRGRDADRELVLMAHQPSQIAMTKDRGVGLQLSGHTHGGQVWPFGAAVALTEPYLKGHHVHDDGTQIYVSCGTGYWGPPLRVGAPPEIASLILTS